MRRRRFIRDESGAALALAVIMIVLIGVMGAGLLVFVQNDLQSVVESNQGQRAMNLADAGVQAARRELLSQPATNLYDASASDNSQWAYLRPSGVATKSLNLGEGTAIVTIQYLLPSTASQVGDPNHAPQVATTDPSTGQLIYPGGRHYFKVISEGNSGQARRRVEAIFNTYDLNVPRAYYTPESIELKGTADITGVSLFTTGNVTITGGASVQGQDNAYGNWSNPPYNTTARTTTAAGIGAGGQISGGSTTNMGIRDFDLDTTPVRFRVKNPPDSPAQSSSEISFPFNYQSQPDIDFLRDEARKQGNYRPVSGGTVPLTDWPTGSTDRTVVFYEFTSNQNNNVAWNVDGTCDDNPPKKGTLVVYGGNFTTAQNKALLSGVVIVRGGNYEDGATTDTGGRTCLDGYINATGTIKISGSVAPLSTSAEANRPGYFGVRLWSWRECYNVSCN